MKIELMTNGACRWTGEIGHAGPAPDEIIVGARHFALQEVLGGTPSAATRARYIEREVLTLPEALAAQVPA